MLKQLIVSAANCTVKRDANKVMKYCPLCSPASWPRCARWPATTLWLCSASRSASAWCWPGATSFLSRPSAGAPWMTSWWSAAQTARSTCGRWKQVSPVGTTKLPVVGPLSRGTLTPKGGQGWLMSPPLSGISGLSFYSPFFSPHSFFCLVLLLFLSCHFSANGPFSWLFSRKFSNISR